MIIYYKEDNTDNSCVNAYNQIGKQFQLQENIW